MSALPIAWQIVFEAGKLCLQFAGATFIAWKTVGWALRRYKTEKHWERRMSAYTELVAALGVLLNILAEWEDIELTARNPVGTTAEEMRNRYWAARRQLDEARGMASLLLPNQVADLIEQLVRDLNKNDNGHHDSFIDKIDGEWSLTLAARDAIVRLGKADLA